MRVRLRPRVLRAGLTTCAIAFAVVAYVYLTLPDVRVLSTTNPSSTAFMELRAAEAARDGRTARRVQRWVPYSRISQSLKRAVLVAEDSAFWEHEGVDIEQIRESIQSGWEQGRAIRGASTITQQLAKNLYFSPSRDPLRKLRELIVARRLEAGLPKVRIFEIYLNVIEWGDGIWGAEAAARTYFGIPASALNREQAALLAGAIINPRVHNPARPTVRLRRRQQIILGRMGDVTPPVPVVAVDTSESPGAPVPSPESTADPLHDDAVDERIPAEQQPSPDAVPGAPSPDASPATDPLAPLASDSTPPA